MLIKPSLVRSPFKCDELHLSKKQMHFSDGNIFLNGSKKWIAPLQQTSFQTQRSPANSKTSRSTTYVSAANIAYKSSLIVSICQEAGYALDKAWTQSTDRPWTIPGHVSLSLRRKEIIKRKAPTHFTRLLTRFHVWQAYRLLPTSRILYPLPFLFFPRT